MEPGQSLPPAVLQVTLGVKVADWPTGAMALVGDNATVMATGFRVTFVWTGGGMMTLVLLDTFTVIVLARTEDGTETAPLIVVSGSTTAFLVKKIVGSPKSICG